MKYIALRGVRCDSANCSRAFPGTPEEALKITHCPACDKHQNRFRLIGTSLGAAQASLTVSPAYVPAPASSLKTEGVDVIMTISKDQNERFLCILAGATIEVKAARCDSGFAFIEKCVRLCDGRQGNYIFGAPTPFVISPRLIACIARGVEVGSFDQLSAPFKDTRAKYFYLDEMEEQDVSNISRDDLVLSKEHLVATITPVDAMSKNAMTIITRGWELFRLAIHFFISDTYALEFEQICWDVGSLHAEEPLPKVDYTPANCSYIVSAVMRDGNACIDAFLSGADHLTERWPDVQLISTGTAAMRPRIWLKFPAQDGSGDVFSKFFTDTFIVHNAQRCKLAMSVTNGNDLAGQLSGLQSRLAALEAAGRTPSKTPASAASSASRTNPAAHQAPPAPKPHATDFDPSVPLLKVWDGPQVKGVCSNFKLVRWYNICHKGSGTLKWLIDSSWTEVPGVDLICFRCLNLDFTKKCKIPCVNSQSAHAYTSKTGNIEISYEAVMKMLKIHHVTPFQSFTKAAKALIECQSGITPTGSTGSTIEAVWAAKEDLDFEVAPVPCLSELRASYSVSDYVFNQETGFRSAQVLIFTAGSSGSILMQGESRCFSDSAVGAYTVLRSTLATQPPWLVFTT